MNRWRSSPRTLTIAAALVPGALALAWMGAGARVRDTIATCSPCVKAKEQARLEGLSPETTPALLRIHADLASVPEWSDEQWSLATSVLSGQWVCPPAEALALGSFYRLILFATLDRCTLLDANHPRRTQVGEALAGGLLTQPPATQIALMLAIKPTAFASRVRIRESLVVLAASRQPLVGKDAQLFLTEAAGPTEKPGVP